MESVSRREFLRTAAIGGAVIALDSAVLAPHVKADSIDLKAVGECKKITITCISEVGWWDTKIVVRRRAPTLGPRMGVVWGRWSRPLQGTGTNKSTTWRPTCPGRSHGCEPSEFSWFVVAF
jgi:hypothetical protein